MPEFKIIMNKKACKEGEKNTNLGYGEWILTAKAILVLEKKDGR